MKMGLTLAIAYLWEQILTPDGLTDILENYAQKTNNRQIWPRYHQLDVVPETPGERPR